MIATDLDGTLVGSRACLEAFLHWRDEHPEWQLVYATGRSMASALELVQEQNLPEPAALAVDVGSRIFFRLRCESGWEEDHLWRRIAAATWRPEAVLRLVRGMDGFAVDTVDDTGDPWGPRGRISGCWDGKEETAIRVEKLLREAGLPVKAVTGRDRLDVIPSTSGKGAAVRYLVRKLGARWVLVCGDSGNDRDMLSAGFPAVVVGNAEEALRQGQWPSSVYIASRPYACGILQGWEHWYGEAGVYPI